jgi:hypothetical protein
MEPFEYSGLWWAADAPSASVAGTLRFSPEDGLVLDLLGTIGGTGGTIGTKAHAIILGTVTDSPWGHLVTLKGCVQARYTMSLAGLSTEGYRVRLAFFGRHLTRSEDFLFAHCSLETSGLSAWAAHLTGFSIEHIPPTPEGGWQIHLNYAQPEPLEAMIPSGVLRLNIGAGSRQTLREQSIKEVVTLDVASEVSMGDDEWNERYVYPLQNFLTLVTDVPNALTNWQLADPERAPSSVKVVGQRVFKVSAEDPAVTPHRMLLPLKGLEVRFPAVVGRWLVVAEEFHDACNIFFGMRYSPAAYVDIRLLWIGQALEVYQARRRTVSAADPPGLPAELLASLPPTVQAEFRRWAESVTIDTFRTTLAQLAEEHRTTLAPLAPHGVANLVDEIVEFRNHALYRKPLTKAPEGYSQRLFLVAETLACLMKSCFLAELGFTPEERANLFHRNAMYGFLRSRWATAAPG